MTKFISLRPSTRDLTGQSFGKLNVIGPIERRQFPSGAVHIYWLCRCSCGKEKAINGYTITAGTSMSCGCVFKELGRARGLANHRHGRTKTTEHRTWSSMRSRCENPDHSNYPNYGGRGIKVCDRWQVFENFLADMGMRPPGRRKYSLGRKDNNGPYSPENCRWETSPEQTQNQRNNLVIEYKGRRGALASFFEGGVDHPEYYRVQQRISRFGWSPHRAFTEPVNSQYASR